MITYLENSKNKEKQINKSNKTCINSITNEITTNDNINNTSSSPTNTSTFDIFLSDNENTFVNFENNFTINETSSLSPIYSKNQTLSIAECINNKILSFLDILPKECIQYILCFLPAKDITTCACTSKKFNYFASSNYIWRKKCIEDYAFFLKHSGIRDLILFSSYAYDIDDNFSKSHRHGKIDPYYYYDQEDRKKMSLINSLNYSSSKVKTASSYPPDRFFEFSDGKKKKEKIKSLTTYSLWQSIRSLKQLYIKILYPFSKYIGLWHADYPFHSGALVSVELVTNIRIKNHTFIKAWILNAKNKTFGTNFFSMDPLFTVDALDYVIEKVPFFEISIKPSGDLMEDDEEEEEEDEKNEKEIKSSNNLGESDISQKIDINMIKSKLINKYSKNKIHENENNHTNKNININKNKDINVGISEKGQTSLSQKEITDQTFSSSLDSQVHSMDLDHDDHTVGSNIDINIHSNLITQERNIQKNVYLPKPFKKFNDTLTSNTNFYQNKKSNKNKRNHDACIYTSNNNTQINNSIINDLNNNNKNIFNINFIIPPIHSQDNLNHINDDDDNNDIKNNKENVEIKTNGSTYDINSNNNYNKNKNFNEQNKNNEGPAEDLINESEKECNISPSPIPIPNNKELHLKNLSRFDIENNSHKKIIPPMRKEDLRILFTESYIPKCNSHHEYYNHFKNYKRHSYNNLNSNTFNHSNGNNSHHNYFNSKSMASYYSSSYSGGINNDLNTNKDSINLKYIHNNLHNNSTENNIYHDINDDKNSENNIFNLSENITSSHSQSNTTNPTNIIPSLMDKPGSSMNTCSSTLFGVDEESQSTITSNHHNGLNYFNLNNTNNKNINLNNNNKTYLNHCSSNTNTTTLSITSQNNLEDNRSNEKSSNVSITNDNDINDSIELIDSNYAFINNSKITIFNYFNPNFCIKKEKIPFTINISYTSCSHPVKLILSPSSDIEFLNEIPNEHTGLWTSKKSFHVLQPSLITVIQSPDSNKNFDNFYNNINKHNIFNLKCSEGCHLNKVRSLSIEEDKKIYGNFLFNTSYSRIILSSYKNSKESKAISLSSVKSDMNLTYSTTLSNSYPLTFNRSPFSILTSAFTSFYSSSDIINQPSIPSLDGIWIGTFGHHGLEFIYIKSLSTNPNNSSKKDSLITIYDGELPIMINTDEYTSDEEEQAQTTSDHFDETDSDVKRENTKIVAYKITGDVNIPKGEISWSAELNHQIDGEITTLEGRTYDITRSIEFRNAKIYEVEGIVAQIGYRDIKKQPGKLIVLSNDEIAIFWETLYRVSRFKRYL